MEALDIFFYEERNQLEVAITATMLLRRVAAIPFFPTIWQM